MRLTLRTLLAYLDNTLEPADADVLRVKIKESTIASNLVTQIEQALASKSIDAYMPDAVGPLEDANAISEYLDSTLSAEQVAELERVCLESETSLAEAAACHQILTMVLGTPSKAPEHLRQRVYDLPNKSSEDASGTEATAGSFAAVDIPDEPLRSPDLDTDNAVDLSGDGQLGRPNSPTPPPVVIPPVGPEDSGVRDAPVRMRSSEEASSKIDPSLMTVQQRAAMHRSEMYGGTVRPSRITPWLVTLGLVAVLLFVMVQIFSQIDLGKAKVALEEKIAPELAEQVPSDDSEVENPINEDPDSGQRKTPETDSTIESTAMVDSSKADKSPDALEPEGDSTGADSGMPLAAELKVGANSGDSDDASGIRQPTPGSGSAEAAPIDADPSMKTAEAALLEAGGSPANDDTSEKEEVADSDKDLMKADSLAVANDPEDVEATEVTDGAVDAAAAAKPSSVAKLSAQQAVVLFRDMANTWRSVAPDSAVVSDVPLTVPPFFRPTFSTAAEIDCTLVGPCVAAFTVGKDAETAIDLTSGRLILNAARGDAKIQIRYRGESILLQFPKADSRATVELVINRSRGADPEAERVRTATLKISAVDGQCDVVSDSPLDSDGTLAVATGKQWERVDIAEATLEDIDEPILWGLPTQGPEADVEASAREGLVEFLRNSQSIQVGLNEAMTFRRAEVGSLAAETLLLLERADGLFRPSGTFNSDAQRFYWTDQFNLLRTVVNLSPERAKATLDGIREADQANADDLIRLTRGYSQAQLEAGEDEKLVEYLTSDTMSVRVLAIENLREITGMTLNYRADLASELRREAEVKKWQVRLRKGEIRRSASVVP